MSYIISTWILFLLILYAISDIRRAVVFICYFIITLIFAIPIFILLFSILPHYLHYMEPIPLGNTILGAAVFSLCPAAFAAMRPGPTEHRMVDRCKRLSKHLRNTLRLVKEDRERD